ncbi:MAG: chorismate-binding protein [Muribaculaceae bacterium]|nr:chorismate-binding protein [Muribaculaceae bacterium]
MEEAFLLCRLPGEDLVRRYAFTGIDGGRLSFGEAELSPWPGECVAGPMDVPEESTPRESYIQAVDGLVALLQKRGGKTVISRQICGSFSTFNPEGMAREYFALFPDMFCFLFHHPSCGWWMGASPELLLEAQSDSTAYTRALAGTRRMGSKEAWSQKNIDEHSLVVNDICGRLEHVRKDIRACAEPCYDFRYGSIEHLCTPIRIESSSAPLPVDQIISAIHPTPAVCGYPREEALAEIAATEAGPRHYYGGVINVKHDGRSTAYVVLRCVHFDTAHWAIYTGSGITAASDAVDEWCETDDKAAPLLSVLSKYS